MSKTQIKKTMIGKFIPAKSAKKYKAHSLVSVGPKNEDIIESLKALSDDIEIAIKHEIRKIVSDDQIQIEVGSPTEDMPKKKGVVQVAFIPELPDHRAVMAVPPQSFGALSELFFGGDPSEIKNSELSRRPVTDTEKRLATRLFNAFIVTVGKAFGKPVEGWTEQWLEKPKSENVAWMTIKVAAENWDFQVHLAWPFGLMDHQESNESLPLLDLREDLELALMNIPLTLKTLVVKETISMEDIASFEKGDILPISLQSIVTAKSGDSAILLGQIKEVDSHLGLQVERNKIGVVYE